VPLSSAWRPSQAGDRFADEPSVDPMVCRVGMAQVEPDEGGRAGDKKTPQVLIPILEIGLRRSLPQTGRDLTNQSGTAPDR
jgi:hypothetical protein